MAKKSSIARNNKRIRLVKKYQEKRNKHLTADYLNGIKAIKIPTKRRKGNGKYLAIKGARGNNLKDITSDPKKSFEEKMEARQQLALLPKNSSPIRVRNRCQKTGRPRGYMRFFGLSRISFRDLALRGHLPGIKKGSL